MKNNKEYIGSQEHWEDSINADYDERQRRNKEQIDDREPQQDDREPQQPPTVEYGSVQERFTKEQMEEAKLSLLIDLASEVSTMHSEYISEYLQNRIATFNQPI